MSAANIVNWKDFDPSRLSLDKPQNKTFDGTKNGGTKGSYAIAKLVYSYPTPNGGFVKDDLYFEQCPINVSGLLEPQEGATNTKDVQIKAVYDISDADVNKFLNVMDAFYKRLCELIMPLKMDLKVKDFNANTATALFKHPIYRPTDSISGEVDITKKPSQFYKLRKTFNSMTQFFSLVEKKPLSWDKVKTAEFKCIPLIVYDRLYAGGNGKISLQSYVSSAVVLPGIRQIGTTNRQANTIDNIKQHNPDYVNQQLQELNELQGISSNDNTKNVKNDNNAEIGEKPISLKSDGNTNQSNDNNSSVNVQSSPVVPVNNVPTPNLTNILNSNVSIQPPINTQVPPGAVNIPGMNMFQLPPGIQLPPGVMINK